MGGSISNKVDKDDARMRAEVGKVGSDARASARREEGVTRNESDVTSIDPPLAVVGRFSPSLRHKLTFAAQGFPSARWLKNTKGLL
jgi:hypothetical protein